MAIPRKIKTSSGVQLNDAYIQSASIRAIRSLKHAPLCFGIEAFQTGKAAFAMRNEALAIGNGAFAAEIIAFPMRNATFFGLEWYVCHLK